MENNEAKGFEMYVRRDIHAEITNAIIEQMEAGADGFEMPWIKQSCLPSNVKTGKAYLGVNTLNLWIAAHINGFDDAVWGTFNQWRSMKASIKAGSRGVPVIYYQIDENEQEADEDGNAKPRILMRHSTVFNIAQTEGYEKPDLSKMIDQVGAVENIDAFVAHLGVDIRIGGDRAYYRPSTDHVQMPPKSLFIGTSTSTPTEAYYSTQFHELGHWTGKEGRCGRDLTGRFGSESYAMEELVAELTAAFACAEFGIAAAPREDHAKYLSSWLKVLKGDKKAISFAASKASAAVAFMKKTAEKGAIECAA